MMNKKLTDEKSILESPWLAKQLAGLVEAPGSLEERAKQLIILARLPLKKQTVSISVCAGRDALVEKLVCLEEYGVLLNLLQCDLARWLPHTDEFSDLKWLLETLLAIKKQATGKKTKVVFQTSSEPEVRESAAMMEALLDEALLCAAEGWMRCLCGPGGDHRVWEISELLSDLELAEVIFSELVKDPRALALMFEEAPDDFLDSGRLNELLELLQAGMKTTQYCMEVFVKRTDQLKG